MKTLRMFSGALFLATLCSLSAYAQMPVPGVPALTTPVQWKGSSAMTFRVGLQGVQLGEINQVLQQAGYGTLPAYFTTFGLGTNNQSGRRRWSMPYEIGVSFSSPTSTNGVNLVSANYFYYKFGFQYHILQMERFSLAPQANFQFSRFGLNIEKRNNSTQTLASVLANPGNAQKADLSTYMGGFSAGLTANYQIPVGKIRTNCESASQNMVVLGFDGGYRFSNRAGLDPKHEISTDNPSVRFTGWYVGLRVGIGTRFGKAASLN